MSPPETPDREAGRARGAEDAPDVVRAFYAKLEAALADELSLVSASGEERLRALLAGQGSSAARAIRCGRPSALAMLLRTLGLTLDPVHPVRCRPTRVTAVDGDGRRVALYARFLEPIPWHGACAADIMGPAHAEPGGDVELGYVVAKAHQLLQLGPLEYRLDDARGRPDPRWSRARLAALEDGCRGLVRGEGAQAARPLVVSIHTASDLAHVFHFGVTRAEVHQGPNGREIRRMEWTHEVLGERCEVWVRPPPRMVWRVSAAGAQGG